MLVRGYPRPFYPTVPPPSSLHIFTYCFCAPYFSPFFPIIIALICLSIPSLIKSPDRVILTLHSFCNFVSNLTFSFFFPFYPSSYCLKTNQLRGLACVLHPFLYYERRKSEVRWGKKREHFMTKLTDQTYRATQAHYKHYWSHQTQFKCHCHHHHHHRQTMITVKYRYDIPAL